MNGKMKRIMALWLALVMALSMAACGSSSDTAQEPEQSEATTEDGAAETTTGAEQQNVTSGEWKNDPQAYLSGVKASEYVTVPSDYLSMQFEVEKKAEVTEEDVNGMVDNLRSIGNEVHDGDTVNINYIGMMDGEQFQGGTANGQYLTIGSGSYIDGFESGLIGAHTGDTVTLDLTFPDPYPNNPDYAGKAVQFIVTVNSVYLAELPELTDEYVTKLALHDEFGAAVTTVDGYRAFVRNYLEEQAEEDYNNKIYNKILAYLSDNSSFANELPKSMIDRYNEEVVAQMTNQALQYGTDLKTLMASYGVAEDQYPTFLRDQAVEQVKYLLALGAIADLEGLTVSDERLDSELSEVLKNDSMAEQGYTSLDSFSQDERESYREYLMRMNVLDFLKKNATITEVEAEAATETTSEETTE